MQGNSYCVSEFIIKSLQQLIYLILTILSKLRFLEETNMSRNRNSNHFMSFINVTPLFGLIWLLYNLIIISSSDISLNTVLAKINLVSGALWEITSRDLLLLLGLITLYVETLKATRSNLISIVNHSLSILVFVIFLVEFLIVAKAGNSTFFLLTLMSLMDAIAGFAITIVAARRDFNAPN